MDCPGQDRARDPPLPNPEAHPRTLSGIVNRLQPCPNLWSGRTHPCGTHPGPTPTCGPAPTPAPGLSLLRPIYGPAPPRPPPRPSKDPSSSPLQISVTPPSLFAPSNPRPRDANWLLSLELSGLRLVGPVAVPPFDWPAAPAFAVPCTLVGAGLAAAGGAGLVGRTEGVDPRSALRLGWSARSAYRRLSRLSRLSLLRLGYFRLRRRRLDLPVPTPDPPRPPTGRPGHGLW